MKLLLALSLPVLVVSCNCTRSGTEAPINPLYTDERPSATLPCCGAKETNKGLSYVSRGVRQASKSTVDVVDDTADYGGIVVDRQARDYTDIAFDAARRSDDVVLREATRYTNYGMDTIDQGADFTARAITRYPDLVTSTYVRGTNSTRKVYQSTMSTYGKTVDRTLWSTLNIFAPKVAKNYMVGSVNDSDECFPFRGSSYKCSMPQLPVEPVAETAGKNPYTMSK
jgi:hypothetical protein